MYFIVVEKQLGSWTNDGSCEGLDGLSCGPGNQKQNRTCTNGTTDKCTTSDYEQTIPCNAAGTALPECPGKG